MALPDKRILSRNVRVGLQQVYGQNPFDAIRNTNTALEAVTDKVKSARLSLGKVKSLADSVNGLKGKFDVSGLKNDFLDMLGINVFKRNLNNLKSELLGLAEDLGIRTRSSIDRLNDLPSPVKDEIGATLFTAYDIAAQGYLSADHTKQVDQPTDNTLGNTQSPTTPVSQTPSSTPDTTQPPTPPVVSENGIQCAVPTFAASTTLTSVLGISNVPSQSVVVIKPASPIPPATVQPTRPPVTVVDPIQTIVTIALIAAAINEYGTLENLPNELKPLIAELLVAMGLDLNDEQILLAGMHLGSTQVLVTLFPDLLDAALAIVSDIPALIASVSDMPVHNFFPTIKPTESQLVQIQQALPPMGAIDPVPLTKPAQIATVVSVATTPVARIKYIRNNFMHRYYPAISV